MDYGLFVRRWSTGLSLRGATRALLAMTWLACSGGGGQSTASPAPADGVDGTGGGAGPEAVAEENNPPGVATGSGVENGPEPVPVQTTDVDTESGGGDLPGTSVDVDVGVDGAGMPMATDEEGMTSAAMNDGGPPAAPPPDCTRELLSNTVDAYFTALAAHDPSMLPTASGVKFTENGRVLELGQGLWENAGPVVYAHSALDTELCMSVSEAVVPDGDRDIPLGLRLRLEQGLLTEIETIAVRAGDYVVASNTNAIIESADAVDWEAPVGEAERDTRERIADWITNYFDTFPAGVCDVTADCRRLENGGGDFPCTLGASCGGRGGGGFGGGPDSARLVVVDVERGIGAGFTMFNLGGSHTDIHMIKMYGGQIYAVHTLLGEAEESGWD